jgi:hypothetical protein
MLVRHLAVIEADGDPGKLPPDAAREASLAQTLSLSPLPHPKQTRPLGERRSPYIWGIAASALLAVGASGFWRHFRESDLSGKGEASIYVFYARDSNVSEWRSEASLQSGDRVMAEVLAPSPGQAFWAVLDRQGHIISSKQRIEVDRLILSGGQRRAFPGSFELTGDNDGETLAVAFCGTGEAAAIDGAAALTSDPRCQRRTFVLRR